MQKDPKSMQDCAKLCIICRKKYTKPPRVGYDLWKIRKYCSPECAVEGRIFRKKYTPCEHCQKPIFQSRSDYTRKFCNENCKLMSKRRTGICEYCGETYLIPFRLRNRSRRFCSRQCGTLSRYRMKPLEMLTNYS